MTIWKVMKTYHDDGIRYQVLPYSISVVKTTFEMEHGVWELCKFLKTCRLTEKGAEKLAKSKKRLLIS